MESQTEVKSTSSTLYDNRKSYWSYLMGDIYAQDDPIQYSSKRKKLIIFLVAMGGLCGPLSSLMYMPALLAVARDLNTTASAVNATVATFLVFMGVSPLFWAALSDQYGRKRMYLMSGVINIVSCILCAISKNITMLIVFRGLQSFGSNAGMTLGAGVIADTISMELRGSAYGIFYIGPLVGPVIGFLCQYINWESTFYFTAILSGVLLILTAAFLPETLRKPKPEVTETKRSALSEFSNVMYTSFKPMVILFFDPTVLLLTAYNTVIFASLYFLNPTIAFTFKINYGYNEWQLGLCYLPLGVGFLLGSVLSGKHSDYVLAKLSKKSNTISEMRLQAALPSFVLIPAGFLIYGWTTEKQTGVYGPLIGLFIYALGQMWAFTPTSVYLVDSKPGYSATAVGVNSFVRAIGAAITSIFSTSVVDALGNGILMSILAGITTLNIGFIITCYYYGYSWRTQFESNLCTRGVLRKDQQ
ncbi:major facilitator superfamily domain-containing protein [Sporodiniella umbellata]|nr:major facilitator superfamily domain-containing protein [Sporodiniella umbellata]